MACKVWISILCSVSTFQWFADVVMLTLYHFPPPGPPAAGPPPGQNLPGEDVHENAGAEAPQPSAPDPSKMDHVSGYDNVGFNTNAGEGL